MHTRHTTLATRMIRLCRMMVLVVVMAMLPTRLANATVPCGDKDAEMPSDLVEVRHKLRKGIRAGDPTYFNKLIVPTLYDRISGSKLFELNKLFESASPRERTGSLESALSSDCEALEEKWICPSHTETLLTKELRNTRVHVGNVAGAALKKAPRKNSATVATLGCRELLDVDKRLVRNDGAYWREVKASRFDESTRGYVRNDDLVYYISGWITYARVGGIWRITERGASYYD